MVNKVHTHPCWIQVLQLLAPGMNVYGPMSPFILQDLAQGTIFTQWGTCVRHEVMMTHLRLIFYSLLCGFMIIRL